MHSAIPGFGANAAHDKHDASAAPYPSLFAP
jgi:hypothetical protein